MFGFVCCLHIGVWLNSRCAHFKDCFRCLLLAALGFFLLLCWCCLIVWVLFICLLCCICLFYACLHVTCLGIWFAELLVWIWVRFNGWFWWRCLLRFSWLSLCWCLRYFCLKFCLNAAYCLYCCCYLDGY